MSKTINAGRVTFVPKDNFSNNISYKKFDIVTYNGSSYFAKKDTIGHTPTEEEFWQLVAEKGQNGAPGAVKMQVVDTLPETGETDTIYLVKKDNPGEQNLYDEYVYTDTGWEHIGDTSVDLSNYYTKNETDNKIFESIPILYNSAPPNNASTNDFDLNSASNIINTLYKTGGKFFMYRNTKYLMPDILVSITMGTNFEKTTRYTGFGVYNNISYKYNVSVRGFACEINGNWTNDLFTCTSIECRYSNKSIEPIIVSSYISDTETDPVQGKVIKKYVDDNVKTYTAGENITISEDNVISVNMDGVTTLTDETIDLAVLKQGVYIVSASVKYIKAGSYSGKTFDIELYTNHSKDRILLVGTGGTTYNIGYLFAGSMLVFLMGYTFGETWYYKISLADLSNTATKKYVDDQVGNINTVLATLTTVSEVTK